MKLNRLDAPDVPMLCASARKTGRLLVAEDCAAAGCVGTRILAQLPLRGIALRAARLANCGSGIVPHGSVPVLLHSLGLDGEGLAAAAEELCR